MREALNTLKKDAKKERDIEDHKVSGKVDDPLLIAIYDAIFTGYDMTNKKIKESVLPLDDESGKPISRGKISEYLNWKLQIGTISVSNGIYEINFRKIKRDHFGVWYEQRENMSQSVKKGLKNAKKRG